MRASTLDSSAGMRDSGDDTATVLERVAHTQTNTFRHAPTQSLNSAQTDERDALVAALMRLYESNPPE